MDAHSSVCAPASAQVIKTLLPLLSLYGKPSEEGAKQIADDLCLILKTQLGAWDEEVDGESLIKLLNGDFRAGTVLMTLFRLAAQREDKSHVFIKDNGVIPHASDLAVLFPKARFVYLVRDPRDVALSWKRSPGHPGGVGEAAQMWVKEQRQALHFIALREAIGRPVSIIRYEELVSQPDDTLKRLSSELKLEFDELMLRFHERKEARRSASLMSGWSNLEKPLLENNTGKYSGALSAREIRKVEAIAGVPMKQLGYLSSAVPKRSTVPDDLSGKLWRAGRTLLQHIPQGAKGYREFKRRLIRLKALQGIEAKRVNQVSSWDK